MIGPLDTQILVNRTLEVQKQHGGVLQGLEDEEQIRKERLNNEINREEHRVQRRSEIVHGRVQDEGKRRGNNAPPKGEKKAKKEDEPQNARSRSKDRHEWRGRFIDLEL
ncbi:MAG TPA: hypothetical protein GXX33_05405 [Firmicutes bacterium]|uniref:Uncharacterized protein n=1 Tax=Capillibacterium thermochitinicola TaxID=2699427 RepID=A0A8J6I1J7_9FIRM|nr:hypothetical protein [Capillibacterium thermochitinicola]MBA2134035.1 hypothetical protein [Capillibacterium thermochitinicola]HHW12421.1 hypothetical protein [Bacillota bacterium]